ncbi:MAG TPA: lamin tail domain-containing protein [Acidimicrobiia bacterium]|nr:lamin tail domain-containing protein [Acidimicrobiia bacterium]
MMRRTTVLVALAVITASCVPEDASRDAAVLGAVLDGDSLTVRISGEDEELRLLGINAPERDECWADEARAALADAIDGAALVIEGDERDRFGRRLGYLSADGTDVAGLLIHDGHAIAMSSAHPRRDDYIDLEWRAFTAERGMWARDACGPPLPRHGVAVLDVEYDAPGPDGDNPNGEWVTIINRGDATDLTGWGVRDESSVHRYRFPDAFVIAGGAEVRILSGCGVDTPVTLHWCADGPVWNNGGDSAMLVDPLGNVVSWFRYFP